MIKILEQKDIENGWEVKVKIDDLDFTVTVDREYWLTLGRVEGETGGEEEIDPSTRLRVKELVRRSFEFLLKNEPKESILRQFNLREIENYFPNYRNEIKP